MVGIVQRIGFMGCFEQKIDRSKNLYVLNYCDGKILYFILTKMSFYDTKHGSALPIVRE